LVWGKNVEVDGGRTSQLADRYLSTLFRIPKIGPMSSFCAIKKKLPLCTRAVLFRCLKHFNAMKKNIGLSKFCQTHRQILTTGRQETWVNSPLRCLLCDCLADAECTLWPWPALCGAWV
jgi:hypothetical protein